MNIHDIAEITPLRIEILRERADNSTTYHSVSFTDILKRIAAVCMDNWSTAVYVPEHICSASVAALKVRGFEVYLQPESETNCDGVMCKKILISWENV